MEDIEDQFKDRHSEEKLMKKRDWISHPPTGESTLVAKTEGIVVGICTIIKHKDKNQLKTIYVLPGYQRRGIGNLLWQEVQKLLDSKKDTIVWVATYNTNAIAFYKKLGFLDFGTRRDNERKMKSGAQIPEMEMIKKANEEQ